MTVKHILSESFRVSCSLRSHTHRLNPKAFSLLRTGGSNIIANEIEEHSFVLTCIDPVGFKKVEQFIPAAHKCISLYVMALNVSTLGLFTWDFGYSPAPIYNIIATKSNRLFTLTSPPKVNGHEIQDITHGQIGRSLMIFGAVGKEQDWHIHAEYIKGIIHFGLNFVEIDFLKEAFGNFYRALENIVTCKILKIKKLSNELKQLQEAVRSLGASKVIVDELAALYCLRSDQVMHSQKKQTAINIDDVFKVKGIVDFVLNKIYEPVYKKYFEEETHRNKK